MFGYDTDSLESKLMKIGVKTDKITGIVLI